MTSIKPRSMLAAMCMILVGLMALAGQDSITVAFPSKGIQFSVPRPNGGIEPASEEFYRVCAARAVTGLVIAVSEKIATQSCSSREAIRAAVEAYSAFVARTKGMSPSFLQEKAHRARDLLRRLVHVYNANEHIDSTRDKDLAELSKVYPTRSAAQSRLCELEEQPPEVALLGDTARTLLFRVLAAEAIGGEAALHVPRSELAGADRRILRFQNPEMEDWDAATRLRINKASIIVRAYIVKELEAGRIQVSDEDIRKAMIERLRAKALSDVDDGESL
ncbi:MAG: hypothetical protein FJ288_13265 [Planctomycetes bacterium]|nr:hypothetical protein [Planctomycetota bacterium]